LDAIDVKPEIIRAVAEHGGQVMPAGVDERASQVDDPLYTIPLRVVPPSSIRNMTQSPRLMTSAALESAAVRFTQAATVTLAGLPINPVARM
jgi:hypothetical protein